MDTTPKSLRLHLAICGRVNAGKSTLFNLISGQNHAITSPERGTTTDVVEKSMELRPLGAAVLLDTAGIDDDSTLGSQRMDKTVKAIDRADAILLVSAPGVWGEPEKLITRMAEERKIPVITILNIPDGQMMSFEKENDQSASRITVCAANPENRDEFLEKLTGKLLELLPESRLDPPLLHDLFPENSLVVLMTPIDSQAPKGRLILPEVMAVRDILDGHSQVLVAREDAFPEIYRKLAVTPALVVCDSQVVHKMLATTPETIAQTTFSILMSRLKGDINEFAAGCAAVEFLRPGDRVLIAEGCTHHAAGNDIGKIQIPQLLEKKCGGKLHFSFNSGMDYPDDLSEYQLVIHCGSCMLNRRTVLNRLRLSRRAGVPVCNYGMCIAACRGVIRNVLSPFPDALKRYVKELDKLSNRM